MWHVSHVRSEMGYGPLMCVFFSFLIQMCISKTLNRGLYYEKHMALHYKLL